jgi:hypothetical protein
MQAHIDIKCLILDKILTITDKMLNNIPSADNKQSVSLELL